MKEKIQNKLKDLQASSKKGNEALGWILIIVLSIALVGIVWFYVQPAVDVSSETAADAIVNNTNAVLGVDD